MATSANTTPYIHPFPNYQLNDLHQSMEYNAAGQPVIRTGVGSLNALSAWGENLTVALQPVLQLDGIYGLDADRFQTYTAGGGTAVSNSDLMFECTSSATLYSYGVLRSRRFLRYRAGQACMARFTAMYSGTAGTSLRAGLFNQESALQVGVNDGQFGVLHFYGARAEIRQLTIATASSGGTATVTVNSVAYNVTLVNGETAIQTAARIARELNGVVTGWIVESKSAKVVFLSTGTGPLTGTYSYSSTGTSTGTFSRLEAGVVGTEDWIYQSDFSLDSLDGTGPSGMTIDTTKLNVFQIDFRWLGAGRIRFSIENSLTGGIMPFHEITWSNENTLPWSHNPNYKIGYVAYNIGGSESAWVRGASMGCFNEGFTTKNDYTRSFSNAKSSLASGTIHQLFSIRNPITDNKIINTREIIIQDLSVAHQGNDPLEVLFFLNANLATGTQTYVELPEAIPTVSTTTGTFTTTNNTPIASFVAGINGYQQYDLEPYRVTVAAGDTVTVAVRSGQSISQIAAAIVWIAD